MGQMLHDKAVFNSARLALVGVADYVLLIAGAVAHRFPFCARRKPGTAHAAQTAGFELSDHSGVVARLEQIAENSILPSSDVRIALRLLIQALRMRLRQRLAF